MMSQCYPLLACMLIFFNLSAYAEKGGISLGQTRIIFSAEDRAQTLTVRNSAQEAYLIQARVQNGLEDITQGPFIVTPPLFSLQGNSSQVLRILPQGGDLPNDRESLFYLSVSAIPAQPNPVKAASRLSAGVRFVIKLFYRPQKLALPAENTPCLLTFRHEAGSLLANNPTGYFQTLGMLAVDGKTIALAQQQAMIPPYSTLMLPIKSAVTQLTWQTITDYGGLSQPCKQAGSTGKETTP